MSKIFKRIVCSLQLSKSIIIHHCVQRSLVISVTKLPFQIDHAIKPAICNNFIRQKHTNKKKGYDSDEEDDNIDYGNDASLNKDSKIVKFKATSMRTDLILKQGLGIARNKIEQIFYESKIRLNGRKILKKSAPVGEGDEIDMVKSVSPNNSNHLYVSRLEVLSAKANEENITVTVRRFKSLLIENYEEHPYKVSETNQTEY